MAPRSISEWPASDRIASEPVARTDQALGDRQRGGRRDRGECDLFFFVLHAAPLARYYSMIGLPSAAAERTTASRMRILPSNCSVEKR